MAESSSAGLISPFGEAESRDYMVFGGARVGGVAGLVHHAVALAPLDPRSLIHGKTMATASARSGPLSAWVARLLAAFSDRFGAAPHDADP